MRDQKITLRLFIVLAILLTIGVILSPLRTGEAQSGNVAATVNREQVFVRIAPAIGHEVIGTLNLGQTVYANGRSANNEWLRIDFSGQEGWVGRVVVDIAGSMNALPVGDPATAPLDYGNGPLAGTSLAVGSVTIRLPESGLRLRGGPSQAYFMMANVPRYEVLSATGRSGDSQWLQVNYRGNLGWIAHMFVEVWSGDISALPVGGIIASGTALNQPGDPPPSANRESLLTAMLLHINVSTNRLDVVEGVWRGILYGNYACAFSDTMAHPQYYIPRDADLIAYPELDPVIASLNEGLEEMGHAIEEWQLLCTLHLQDYPITNEIVQTGLETIYHSRRGFDLARQQVFALGIVPTPIVIPGFTPAAPIATVTPPANAPDLMAFTLQDNRITFVPQFIAPELGCNWQGLGGQIFGMNNEPLIGFTVRVEGVTESTFFFEAVSGADTTFGPSGWHMQVGSGPSTFVYTVTIYQDGRRVSDPKTVNFPNDCDRNLGIMNYVQVTPLE